MTNDVDDEERSTIGVMVDNAVRDVALIDAITRTVRDELSQRERRRSLGRKVLDELNRPVGLFVLSTVLVGSLSYIVQLIEQKFTEEAQSVAEKRDANMEWRYRMSLITSLLGNNLPPDGNLYPEDAPWRKVKQAHIVAALATLSGTPKAHVPAVPRYAGTSLWGVLYVLDQEALSPFQECSDNLNRFHSVLLVASQSSDDFDARVIDARKAWESVKSTCFRAKT